MLALRCLLVLSVRSGACDLTGVWTYDPEPGTRYEWRQSAADGSLACFTGKDFWRAASGALSGGGSNNLTLTFGDPACPGAARASGLPIRKWGTVSAGCDRVVMADTQPNCPAAGSCSYSRAPPPPPPCPSLPANGTPAVDVPWLACISRRIIAGCQQAIPATEPPNPLNARSGANATAAFTPDATHTYGAQWTRDFFYIVAGAAAAGIFRNGSGNGNGNGNGGDGSGNGGDMADLVRRAVRYTFAGQRAEDGCMPDRVTVGGAAVYGPGSGPPAWPDHAWDNGPFAALLLAAATTTLPAGGGGAAAAKALFCELQPAARRALDFVNRSAATGLVWNDVSRPNCTYGFTDTVAKSGALLFSSLLYYDASRQLAALAARYADDDGAGGGGGGGGGGGVGGGGGGCGDAARYTAEADLIARHLDDELWGGDEEEEEEEEEAPLPLWLAASHDNRLPDVWGSAYLVALNLGTAARRQRAMDELVAHPYRYFLGGQVRHLPLPLTWQRCCWTPGCEGGCAANGTYQNGAFWATPLSYVVPALAATGHAAFAKELLLDAVADFKLFGVYEDVDRGLPAVSNGVLNYTASATNALLAATSLAEWEAQQRASLDE